MNIDKKIKIKWTFRNVERMHKWLNLKSDFQGFLIKNNKRCGYKTTKPGFITFHLSGELIK